MEALLLYRSTICYNKFREFISDYWCSPVVLCLDNTLHTDVSMNRVLFSNFLVSQIYLT